MTTFYWVRHGPTHQKNFVGWRDVPADLSDKARIARLNRHLPDKAVVVSSDLKRSVDTATALEPGRIRLPHLSGLREFHFGSWDGQHHSAISKTWPAESRAYWETPGDTAPPGGESWNAAALRVSVAAKHLARLHPGGKIVVVAHIGVILTQVQQALGCTASEVLSHKIDNLSVTEIELSESTARVNAINYRP